MLITSSESTIIEQHTETIQNPLPKRKALRLADLKVDTLICGGIDSSSRELLRAHGIKVIANMKGKIDDALSCYVTVLRP